MKSQIYHGDARRVDAVGLRTARVRARQATGRVRFVSTEVTLPNSCVALLLAGGSGSRMKAAGGTFAEVPKLLLPVEIAGLVAPMIEIALSGASDAGVPDVVVLTSDAQSAGGRAIEAYLGTRRSGAGVRALREHGQCGTGGAVYAATRRIFAETVLVLPGDTALPFAAIRSGLAQHHAYRRGFTWFATSVPGAGAQNPGRLAVGKGDGHLIASYERGEFVPPTMPSGSVGLTSVGAVALDVSLFVAEFERYARIHRGPVDLHRDLLPDIAKRHAVHVHDIGVPAPDLGVPERYLASGGRAASSMASR